MTRANNTQRGIAIPFAAVTVLHILGWGLLLAAADWTGKIGAITLGTGALAYMLGLRHAFDADHIAAIDNSTRRLLTTGKHSGTVGLWFSLGHSTVVFTVSALIAVGLASLGTAIADEGSPLRQTGATIGATVSGGFLLLIAVLNVIVLVNLIKTSRQVKSQTEQHAHEDDAHLENHLNEHLDRRGILNRLFRPVARTIDKPWKMYPLGILFGLGFDTASSVAMLAIAGGTALSGGNPIAIIALPLVFTAGMALGDTLDGVMMERAYSWAHGHHDRRLRYNITVTSVSIAAALLVGVPIVAGVVSDTFGLTGGFWDFTATLDYEYVGFALLGLFLILWAVSWASWKREQSNHRAPSNH